MALREGVGSPAAMWSGIHHRLPPTRRGTHFLTGSRPVTTTRSRLHTLRGTVQIQVPIQKLDSERQMAFGWANVFLTTDDDPIVDSHGDTIDTAEAIAAIEDAVYQYTLDSRSGDDSHVNFGVARLVETMVFTDEKLAAIATHSAAMQAAEDADADRLLLLARQNFDKLQEVIPDGWWVGFKIDDPDAWAKVKDGSLSMFSIVGRAERRPVDATV